MILPSKHLSQERALLSIGGHIIAFLTHPKTVSSLWEEFNRRNKMAEIANSQKIDYDWFVLSLDVLYILGAIELENGLIARRIN